MKEEKEFLESLVKDSISLTEVLRKTGKSVSGASLKILKQKLDEYGIKYSFLKEKEINKERVPLSEVLKENSNYSSSRLKKRLISEGLKKDVRENCGIGPIWNGNPLTLQLDHINGDHFDNRLENLRILCPNCHSQTETFGGKKIKKVNLCCDCGKPISDGSLRCKSCSINERKNRGSSYKVKPEDRPSKEELLKLVLNKSFTEIGKMYGVTDSAIRKWCKKLNLPYSKETLQNFLKTGNPYL